MSAKQLIEFPSFEENLKAMNMFYRYIQEISVVS
jgi:hypothetical protein